MVEYVEVVAVVRKICRGRSEDEFTFNNNVDRVTHFFEGCFEPLKKPEAKSQYSLKEFTPKRFQRSKKYGRQIGM